MKRAAVVALAIAAAACGGPEFSAGTAELVGPTEGGAGTGPDGARDVGPDAHTEGGQGGGGAGGSEAGADTKMADAGPTTGEDASAPPDAASAVDGRPATEGGGFEGGLDVVVVDVADAGQGSDGDGSDGNPCGPTNCAGCCTAAGECLQGTTVAACGAAGRACAVCAWRCAQGTAPHCSDAASIVQALPPICRSDGYCDITSLSQCCGTALDSCDPTVGCR